MRRRLPLTSQICAILAVGALSPAPLPAADFTVNVTGDDVDATPGDAACLTSTGFKICSLRAAIQETNALAGPDVITLPAGRYTLTIPGTGEDDSAEGDLDITDALSIVGDGADQTVIDAAGIDRVFHVTGTGASLILQKLTVTGGEALGSSPLPARTGGGVLVEAGGLLDLRFTRVFDNAAFLGGGIGGLGSAGLEILNSEVTRNESRSPIDSTISGGGIFFAEGTATSSVQISESTISHNGCSVLPAADCVGGVSAGGCGEPPGDLEGVNVVNSTVSNNEGHGLSAEFCTSSLRYATIYGNTGYGFRKIGHGGPTILPLVAHARRSIFANNGIADCDLAGGLSSTEANLSSDASCDLTAIDDQINTDPDLYPLGYHVPPPPRIAPVHHPRWGAPVVDVATTYYDQPKDQDGFDRGGDGSGNGLDGYDIGSVEAQPCVVVADRVYMNQSLPGGTHGACNTITADPNVIINGYVVFDVRDSVTIGNGFEMTPGSTFTVSITRDAGSP